MKVLHVLDHSLPYPSGYSFRSKYILEHQRAIGLEPIAVTSPKHEDFERPEEEREGIVYHRTAWAGASMRRSPVLRELALMRRLEHRILEVASRHGARLIHAHSPSLNGIPALRVARRLRLPAVYEIRAFWEEAAVDNGITRSGSLRYRATRASENYVIKRADAVVTICRGLRDGVVGRGFAAEKVFEVPNGVDLARFQPRDRNRELGASLGLEGRFVLGFIGSFYSYEGLRDLIAATGMVLGRRRDVALLLVGQGEEEEEIRRMAQALPGGSVVFAGHVQHSRVLDYYSLVDLFVYPRRSTPLTESVTPLKPLEAMAMGKLVLGSDVGGVRELIADGVTGWLFKAGDAGALAAKIIEIIESRPEHARVSARAREFVARERSWPAIVARYLEVYEFAEQRRNGFGLAIPGDLNPSPRGT